MTKHISIAFLLASPAVTSFTPSIVSRTSTSTTSLYSTTNGVDNISRRNVFAKSASIIVGGLGITASSPFSAKALITEETPVVTNRMGGLLERYQDSRGWRILAPSGWNKFEGEVGAYDVKWQDVVDPTENVKVSSSPVKSTTTSIDALGEVETLGIALAGKRSAKLVSAEERLTDGILFYTFDFALKDNTHQLLLLCVNKGKVWSLDANSKQARWVKRESLYKNILGSFMPKLS